MKKVDVTKHVLIPKHVKLGEKEKAELLERYKITVEALPKILKSDAAISELSVKDDDVIKIVRASPTAGESVFYRVVANA